MRLDSTSLRVEDWREELRVGESATIGPSEMKNVQLSLGDHRLRLEVDKRNLVAESDEADAADGVPFNFSLGSRLTRRTWISAPRTFIHAGRLQGSCSSEDQRRWRPRCRSSTVSSAGLGQRFRAVEDSVAAPRG